MRRLALGLLAALSAALAVAPGMALGQQQTFSTISTGGKAPAPQPTPASATVSGIYFNYYQPYGPNRPTPPPCRQHCPPRPRPPYPPRPAPLAAPKVAPPHR